MAVEATDQIPRLTMLSIDEARRCVNAWASAGILRVKNMGDRMHLEDIVPLSSYSLKVQTQYEERTVSQVSKPYRGGPIDDQGTPPSPWDIACQRPTDFTNRTENINIPHTERVLTCPNCGGTGQTNCGPCQGWGKVNCNQCQGRGYRERPAVPGQVNPGQPMVRENCPSCFAGKVNCPACQGRGRVVCTSCQGGGRVKTCDVLRIRFHHKTESSVIDSTAVPDYLIGKASGDVLTDERDVVLKSCPSAPADVQGRANDLLRKSQAVSPNDTIFLLQQLRVERVPIFEVVYRYPSASDAERKLWIYGTEQNVHAPNAPTNWMRILAVLGGLVLAAATVLAAVLIFTR